jgi:hypothetical protein
VGKEKLGRVSNAPQTLKRVFLNSSQPHEDRSMPCKCGSSSHTRISHTDCPLNKKKAAGLSAQLDSPTSLAKKGKRKATTDESIDTDASKPKKEPFENDSDNSDASSSLVGDFDDDTLTEEEEEEGGVDEEEREDEQSRARLATDYEHRLCLTFPAHIKTLSAENKIRGTNTGFTVWKQNNYLKNGFHSASHHAAEFDSVFASMDDANQRAKYAFYVLNPWGIDLDDLLGGKKAKASKKGGLLTMGAKVSGGKEKWEAGVMLSSDFKIEKNRLAPSKVEVKGSKKPATQEEVEVESEVEDIKTGVFSGKKFVFTGELQSMGRPKAEGLVTANGGQVISAVSRKTTYLVCGSEEEVFFGVKYSKAEELNAEFDEKESQEAAGGTAAKKTSTKAQKRERIKIIKEGAFLALIQEVEEA